MPRVLSSVFVSLATVYVIWGSTYLAIAVAEETLPPFLMASVRLLTAGTLLLAWALARGAPWPSRREWLAGGVLGAFLFLGGNGLVVWAEQSVPSGLAAVLVATVAPWTVLLDWARPGGTRPGGLTLVAVGMGLAGVCLLALPSSAGSSGVPVAGCLALVASSLSWAVGSLAARALPAPASPSVATAIPMLTGGVWLAAATAASGEGAHAASTLAGASVRSWAALLYLVSAGSIVAYSAYAHLLRHASPVVATSYAYVNPVVAVALGAIFHDERLTARSLAGTTVIVAAVALLSVARTRASRV